MNQSSIIELLYEADKKGITLLVEENKLKVRVEKGVQPDPQVIRIIKSRRDDLIEYLSSKQGMPQMDYPPIEVLDRSSNSEFEASFQQKRMFFLDQLNGTQNYHEYAAFKVVGDLEPDRLGKALKQILKRHEALRTVLYERDAKILQSTIDYQGFEISEAECGDQLSACLKDFISNPFDLSQDFMVRVGLFFTSRGEKYICFVIHHIAGDGWSLPIFFKEMVHYYLEGPENEIPTLPFQYADYSQWQQNYLSGDVLKQKLTFWGKQLHGMESLSLPLDHSRPVQLSGKGRSHVTRLRSSTYDAIKEVTRATQTTLFSTLMATYQVLLYKYSGQRNFAIGTPVANRQQEELGHMIGFFTNTLAFHIPVLPDLKLSEHLRKVKEIISESISYQDAPFDQIVRHTEDFQREAGQSPLFQTMFVLNEYSPQNTYGLGDIVLEKINVEHEISRFDLSLELTPLQSGELEVRFEYSTDLFEESTISRLAIHFEKICKDLIESPDLQIRSIDLISSTERDQILHEFNSERKVLQGNSIVDQFAKQVNNFPNREAVYFAGQSFTYQQLNELVEGLATELKLAGVKKGDLVPVVLGRSVEMVATLMGIWKVGATYVPIDSKMPQARIDFILKDINPKWVIVQDSTKGLVQPDEAEMLVLEQLLANKSEKPDHEFSHEFEGDELAYVIYTSGTTGKPKGTLIQHQAVFNSINGQLEVLGVNGEFRMLGLANYAFDISVFELFSPLVFGGTLILADDEESSNLEDLKNLLAKSLPTHMESTPSFWQAMIQSGWSNDEQLEIIWGGEPLSEQLKAKLIEISPHSYIWTMYGPTENTISSTCGKLYLEDQTSIGRPLPNVQIRVLSDEHQLQPIGIPGELFLGGDQLAKGYLKLEELSDQRFITISEDDQTKWYKSGDIGRWLPDGTIEFLGRDDDQVKIRGLRVELGEITNVIEAVKGVSRACVVQEKDQNASFLVGYITTITELEKAQIFRYLKQELPAYMIPTHLILLDQFPLTQNGKVDRSKLPAIEYDAQPEEFTAPQSEAEKQIAGIWQELLGLDKVSITTGFFELGGHSLMAVQMVSLIHKRMGITFKLHQVFEAGTIQNLAALTDEVPDLCLEKIDLKPSHELAPLSQMQERIWFIDKIEGSLHYHIPLAIRFEGSISVDRLAHAIKCVVLRHDTLRTVICEDNGSAYQNVLDASDFEVSIINKRQVNQVGVTQLLSKAFMDPFDLSMDFMIRAHIIEVEEQEVLLSIVLHHIAADGFSAPILLREIEYFYSIESSSGGMPSLEIQYSDFAFWQRNLQTEHLQDQAEYWRQQLNGVPSLELPTDFPRPAIQENRGDNYYFTISQEKLKELQGVASTRKCTLFTLLLSVYVLLLRRYTQQDDICVGVPVANREHPQIAPLIGFFVNSLAIRVPVHSNDTFDQLLVRVIDTLNAAYKHQDLPFGDVVDLVSNTRDQSRSPVFQTMINLQNEIDLPTFEEGTKASLFPFPMHTSKFDLEFDIISINNGLTIRVEYSTALFKPSTIKRLAGHFESLIEEVIKNPKGVVDQFCMVSGQERNLLLNDFNRTEVQEDFDQTFLDVFKAQVKNVSNKIAVQFEDKRLTYSELDQASNQLANYLANRGIASGALIPIIMDRDELFLVSMLGIWKSGAAYVPIDPNYPIERTRQILTTVAPDLVIVSYLGANQELLSLAQELKFELVTGSEAWQEVNTTPLDRTVKAADLSYVIFTSGSTGIPKGAMVEHRGMLNHFNAKVDVLKLNEKCVVAQNASQTFDISVWQFCVALLTGGTTSIYGNEVIQNPQRFVNRLEVDQVNILEVVPSYLGLLLDQLDHSWISEHALINIQYLMVTGEDLQPGLVNRWLNYFSEIPIVNAYGPTEASDDITHHVIREPQKQTIPVGVPIRNMNIYILNDSDQLCGIGIKGELCVSGIGVGRGYLKDPEKTKNSFTVDPFRPGTNMYRTGDVALIREDGVIEFHGRRDNQVKIRGNRIELAEIENALLSISEKLKGAVVLAKKIKEELSLVAYLESTETPDLGKLRLGLMERIPAYMIPDYFITLDHFPLSNSGKVDRKQLPDVDASLVISPEIVLPSNQLEEQLLLIWHKVLSRNSGIGITQDFFELGGNSILAIKMVAEIQNQLNVEVKLNKIFSANTIEKLALYLDTAHGLGEKEDSEEVETTFI